MPGIKIVTDSTTDLPKELLDKHQVEVIPLTVLVEGETYYDNVTITPEDFLVRMKASRELPKTSQPSVGVLAEAYDRLGANGDTILSIHMTSGMSGTYSAACSAAEMSASRVKVIDSQMISQALGFQVLEAARMAEAGESLDKIVARLDELRKRTTLLVVVDTLENLIKGGRIGRAAGLIGMILNVKPIAMLEEGVYSPFAKVRTASQIIEKLMHRMENDIRGRAVRGIGLSHADNLPLAMRLKEAIARLTDVPVSIRPATPVITTHTGPGAIGLMYYAE
jgi:DegV family protein with EDD domain